MLPNETSKNSIDTRYPFLTESQSINLYLRIPFLLFEAYYAEPSELQIKLNRMI